MPEVSLEVAKTPNNTEGGDVEFDNLTVRNFFLDTTIELGTATAKANPLHGLYHWDTSQFGMGTVVNKVKFEHRAAAGHSTPFDLRYEPLTLNPKLNLFRRSFHDGILVFGPQTSILPSVPIWTTGTSQSGGNDDFEIYGNQLSGLGSISQAFIPTRTIGPGLGAGMSLFTVGFFLKRTGTFPSGSMRVRLYLAEGVSGSYYRSPGAVPFWTSDWRPLSDLTTAYVYYHFQYDLLGDGLFQSPSIIEGVPLIAEFEHNAPFTGSKIHVKTHISHALGATENITLYGVDDADTLQGFADKSHVKDGTQMFTLAQQGSDLTPAMTWVNGTIYSFGSTEYGPASATFHVLNTIKASLQAILDARTSLEQWFGLRIDAADGTGTGDVRIMHSVRSATETRDGLFGTLMTIDYTDPNDGLYRPKKYGRIARQTIDL